MSEQDEIASSIPAVLVGLAVALFVAIAFSWLLQSAAVRRARGSPATDSPVPCLWRIVLACGQPLEKWVRRIAPAQVLGDVERLLRAAGWDDHTDPSRWLSACLVWSTGSTLIAGLTSGRWIVASATALLVTVLPWVALRGCSTARERRIARDLPFCLDLLVLALEAGSSLPHALGAVIERMPAGTLAMELGRLQADLRAGRPRAAAFEAMGRRLDAPATRPFVAALLQSESTGGGLSDTLRAQAEQRLAERFLRAERLAMQAPVKMLGPLILCIFPCTFIVLGFPIAMKLLQP